MPRRSPTIHIPLENQALPTAINLAARRVYLDNGRTIPITNMYDAAAAETDDLDEVITIVAGNDEQGWYSLMLEECPSGDFYGTMATVH
jgi:hypothetical protein